jgi:hypothetical protein
LLEETAVLGNPGMFGKGQALNEVPFGVDPIAHGHFAQPELACGAWGPSKRKCLLK